ncbi:MAG: acetyl-CoA decarbonylase/synthase complex subunit gamma [Chloroflexi bacterium]|nr:MAG: acetyl-CoA decarbonylase/synthase complex subunit gamma [Chloroflexota bacterium]RLC97251.1 MAG: acetyl-CoA decarbonylase/synthase complex subunit gamma [Chloroflexota bacterium]
MAVKGTDIVKKLPESGKKNCKECGFPTCFAFAMKLASGGATLDKCPYLAPNVKEELEDALAPAIKLVTIGPDGNALQVGNEEVIYRHEKTYFHPTGVALLISDKEDDAKVDQKIAKIKDLQFDVVGLTLKADLLALQYESGDKAKFEALVKKVCQNWDGGLVIISDDLDVLFSARDICADRKPLLYPITKDNIEKAIPRIKERPTPLGVRASSVEELVPLTTRLKEEKLDELVLDPGSSNLMEVIRDQTFIRRSAIKQSFRPLGYPTIGFPCYIAKDGLKEVLTAAAMVIKYTSIVVLSDFEEYTLRPLLTLRLNIYTDPRMPLSVEEKLYEVGEPDKNAPVLITTNWALTYFIVSAEVESSKVPSFLLVKDAEGLGVLTAWAAGKFTGDSIAPFVKRSGVEDKTNTRTLVIPGKVARIKGELEDALPGWEIVVGPREASEIPGFLPGFAAKLKS